MKQLMIIVCLCLYMGTTHGRLGKEAMRKALKQNPLFSHQRNSPIPFLQNVNIRLPIDESSVPVITDPPSNARPVALEAKTSDRGVPVQQKTRITPVRAGRPVREHEIVLGQIKPANVVQQQSGSAPAPGRSQQRKVATNSLRKNIKKQKISNVRPAANIASAEQRVAARKQECSFHIPSFLLPDPHPSHTASSQSCPSFLLPGPSINPELVNLMVEHWTGIKRSGKVQLNGVKSQITQVEFEQKCLIPALRAHVLGGPACKTRELKVYLEWLLYLRQRLFNI